MRGVIFALAVLALFAVVAANIEISDVDVDSLGDVLRDESMFTRGTVRRHGRFTRAQAEEENGRLMKMLSKLNDETKGEEEQDDEDQDESEVKDGQEDEDEDDQDDAEDAEKDEGEDDEPAEAEEQEIAEHIEDSDQRGDLRRDRREDAQEDRHLKKDVRRENGEQGEEEDTAHVNGILRRDFSKLSEQNEIRTDRRDARRASRHTRSDKLREIEEIRQRRQARERFRRWMRRVQNSDRRQFSTKKEMRRAMRMLRKKYREMSSRIDDTDGRDDKEMSRRLRRFTRHGKNGRRFRRMDSLIRRQRESAQRRHLAEQLASFLAHGFRTDEKDENRDDRDVDKDDDEDEEEDEDRRRFRHLEHVGKRGSREDLKAERRARRAEARRLREKKADHMFHAAFRGLTRLMQHVAARSLRVGNSELAGRLHGATMGWLQSQVGGDPADYAADSSLGRIVHGAVRHALWNHFQDEEHERERRAYYRRHREEEERRRRRRHFRYDLPSIVTDGVTRALKYRDMLAAQGAPQQQMMQRQWQQQQQQQDDQDKQFLHAYGLHDKGEMGNIVHDAVASALQDHKAAQDLAMDGAIDDEDEAVANAQEKAKNMGLTLPPDYLPEVKKPPLIRIPGVNVDIVHANDPDAGFHDDHAPAATEADLDMGDEETLFNSAPAADVHTFGDVHSAETLLPGDSPTALYQVVPIGPEFAQMKQTLRDTYQNLSTSPVLQVLFTAIAMQYSTALEHEKQTKVTAQNNLGILGLNAAMATKLGYPNPSLLQDPSHLADEIKLLTNACAEWGVARTLNFLRGGPAAFNDGHSNGVDEYRSAIATICHTIDNNPLLMTNGDRVEIYLKGSN